MRTIRFNRFGLTTALLFLAPVLSAEPPLSVAVSVEDVESIAKAVGGKEIQTFPLFKGCLARPGLEVEEAARGRLPSSDAVVWTGFFGESSAIHAFIRTLPPNATPHRPTWIDVSPGTRRVNIPTTDCYGVTDTRFMYGDPFFWLNPENGLFVARNLAEGFTRLRPSAGSAFHQRAEAFARALKPRITAWRTAMARHKGLRVFATQCGWQNLTGALPGPMLGTFRNAPGQLPTPAELVDHVRQLKAEVVLLDPNTPPEYGAPLRDLPGVRVVLLPSSVEHLADKRYGALVDAFLKALDEAREPLPLPPP